MEVLPYFSNVSFYIRYATDVSVYMCRNDLNVWLKSCSCFDASTLNVENHDTKLIPFSKCKFVCGKRVLNILDGLSFEFLLTTYETWYGPKEKQKLSIKTFMKNSKKPIFLGEGQRVFPRLELWNSKIIPPDVKLAHAVEHHIHTTYSSEKYQPARTEAPSSMHKRFFEFGLF